MLCTHVNLFNCNCASLRYIKILNLHSYVHFCRSKQCVRDDVVIKQRKYSCLCGLYINMSEVQLRHLAVILRIAPIVCIIQ